MNEESNINGKDPTLMGVSPCKEMPSPISPSKRELAPDDFLTRAEKLKKKKIPTTTETSIIVRSNNEGLGFRFDCYPAHILENVLSKEMFDSTVKEANKICENAWTEKKKHENLDFHPLVSPFYRVAIFSTFLGLLLLLIYMYSDSGFALFPISFVFIGIGCVLMILIAIISVVTEPKFIGLEKTTRIRLKSFLEEENMTKYRSRGFVWRIERDFFWLQLVNLNGGVEAQEGNQLKLNFNR